MSLRKFLIYLFERIGAFAVDDSSGPQSEPPDRRCFKSNSLSKFGCRVIIHMIKGKIVLLFLLCVFVAVGTLLETCGNKRILGGYYFV